MKKFSLIALIGASSLFVFSCQDDTATSEPEFPEKFSKLTVAENKAQLENNGISLINEMEGIKNNKSIEAAENLLNLMQSSDEEAPVGGRLIQSVSNLKEGSTSAREVFSAMRLNEEDPESLQALFDEHAGTYTWNATTEEWDQTTGGDKIILKFPSTETGTKNNAILSLGDYKGTQIANPVDEEYTGDLPTNFLMNLTVDGATTLEYSFKATYNKEGVPNKLDTYLSIAPYSYTVKFSNDTKKIDASYSLTKDEKVLIAAGSNASGNFTESNIENAEDDMGELLTDAAAYFQVMNIKVSGSVDVKNLTEGLNAIDYDNLDDKETSEKEAELYNENYKLMVYYADSKEKIADTEFYTNTYTDWGHEYTEVELRMVFADGSKSEFETYFESGFNDLQEEIEDLMEIE